MIILANNKVVNIEVLVLYQYSVIFFEDYNDKK